jgi:hypothetical protein
LFGNKTWLVGCLEDEPSKVVITLGENLHDLGVIILAEDVHEGKGGHASLDCSLALQLRKIMEYLHHGSRLVANFYRKL